MDSSLPVLVSRLSDRRALARLVRAALRHEIAYVDLARGPQRAEAHALDLHVLGDPPLALLAEPAGAGRDGRFPLRLRPLYRAQTAELYALLEAEAIDGTDSPPEPVGGPGEDLACAENTAVPATGAPSRAAARGESIPPGTAAAEATHESPRDQAPAARAFEVVGDEPIEVVGDEPIEEGPAYVAQSNDDGAAPHADASADDPSLSVSVVFEPDDLAAAAEDRDATPQLASMATDEERRDVERETSASSGAVGRTAEPARSEDSFFDDILARFPVAHLEEAHLEEAHLEHSDGRSSQSDTYEVQLDEVELLTTAASEAGALESEAGGTRPRESASAEPRTGESAALDEDAATLIRLAPAGSDLAPRFADDARESEPTLTRAAPTKGALGPPKRSGTGRGRKKKSTRRRPMDREATSAPAGSASTQASGEAQARTTRTRDRHPLAPDERQAGSVASSPEGHPGRARWASDPAIGRRIADGKYVIESLIGSGASGAVYRGTHRDLRRTVAIKLLHPHYQQDPQFMTSFRGEALAASLLDHPNVMRVLDFGQEPDGLVYIVMEFLSGRTLQSLLDEERRLPTDRAVEIMIQVCAAVSVAHDHGIIHRDIKPDNIMLVPSRDDEGATFELVKVCDFGIAALESSRAEDAELSATEHVIAGTPEYMSPEQARGLEVDARSDVYACGICLYELVTGRPPFLGDAPAEILIKQLEEIPKPPSHVIKGLDPIVEEVILRAIQKDPAKRHQSARELRVELKELIDPGEGHEDEAEDERSIVENVPVLDDPASGFPGFFIAFSSAILRFGRFEPGHHEFAQAMKELQRALRVVLKGRSELTFARRDLDAEGATGFAVMSGTAEIVDLRRLLGSQLMGSFGDPFVEELVRKDIASLTVREGLPDVELTYLVEMMRGPLARADLRSEVLSKPVRYVSVLFVSDVMGADRKLAWKVGLCISRLTRDLRALCNVRGISLKKMRETRAELVGGVARLLTRGDEVRQFIFHADLVDETVANLRGFSSFRVAPLIVERVLHDSCVEAAMLLLTDFDAGAAARDRLESLLRLFAQRLVTERSPKSDAAVSGLLRRGLITEDEIPLELRESIRAESLADALVREPSQFLLRLDLIGTTDAYVSELGTLEAAMATLARRSEAVALLAVMSTLARHAKTSDATGTRQSAAVRAMKSMIDEERLLPIATTLLVGPVHQREAARQIIVIAGSAGAQALYMAREATTNPAARPIFVKVLRETGPAGYAVLSQMLPRLEVRDDVELALVEDLLRAVPDRGDAALGEVVAKFLAHPILRRTALKAIAPLWGDRARKPLVEALEYAEESARIVALAELRRLRAIDEYVFSVLERFLTMRGIAGEGLRAAAASALADVATPLRPRAIQILSKSVEGKRGFFASLRGSADTDASVVVMEAMGKALLALDRNEGMRALKLRLSRSEGLMRARLSAVLETT